MVSGAAASLERQAAFLLACGLDVAVRKPGNVSIDSAGHGMAAEHFLASAWAAAPVLVAPAPVGARLRAAVESTWRVAGCNTNLGILLLAAPMLGTGGAGAPRGADDRPTEAEASSTVGVAVAWQGHLQRLLQGLTRNDATEAFAAIARAQPGGLGQAAAHDVHAPATVTLLQAMESAADRDRIAWEYSNGGQGLWQIGLPALLGLPTAEDAMRVLDAAGASPFYGSVTRTAPGVAASPAAAASRRDSAAAVIDALRAGHAQWRTVLQAHSGADARNLPSAATMALLGETARRSAGLLAPAVRRCYLGWLVQVPDTHLRRKHGDAVAQTVSQEAQAWWQALRENPEAATQWGSDPAFAAWDERLKAQGLNPGTSADLTVATLLLAGMLAAGVGPAA